MMLYLVKSNGAQVAMIAWGSNPAPSVYTHGGIHYRRLGSTNVYESMADGFPAPVSTDDDAWKNIQRAASAQLELVGRHIGDQVFCAQCVNPELKGIHTCERAQPPSTQDQASQGNQTPLETQAPGDVTRTWASKWLHFCRSYGIDPTRDVSDVIARFDHTGEERERIAAELK